MRRGRHMMRSEMQEMETEDKGEEEKSMSEGIY